MNGTTFLYAITLSTFILSTVLGSVVSAQEIVREYYVSNINMEVMRTLTQDGTILAKYRDLNIPMISTDGGNTFRRVLTPSEVIDIGNKITIAADGYGHGIIANNYRLLTSDAGTHWEKIPGGLPLEPKGFQLQSDGNGRDMTLIADYGRIRTDVILPDTFPDKATWEGILGYSYSRGSLTRTTDGSEWYCVNHVTGEFTRRNDFPPVKSYTAGELANGAKMFAFMPKFGKLLICLPGDTCIKIDSLLESYGHRLIEHFNDYIVQDFASGPQAVILGPNGYRIIDSRKLVPGNAEDLFIAGCNSVGLAVFTQNFCAFIPHDGSEPIIVPATILSPDGSFALTNKTLLFQTRYSDMVTIDFNDKTIRLTGTLKDEAVDLAKRIGIRDVFVGSGHCKSYSESGHVLEIDTTSQNPFIVAFSTAGRVVPEKINLYELQSLAVRRTEAMYGCSGFAGIAPDITASGTPRGIRLEFHSTRQEKLALSDTITTVASINNGKTIVAAHRKAWISADTGTTWTEMTTPNLGSVISSYASVGGNDFLGYRGFTKTVNDSTVAPIPGGLYMRTGSGNWAAVDGIPHNYIYGLSTDADSSLWVVATNASLHYIVDKTNADSLMQIETKQNNILVYRSSDAGTSWQLMHTEIVGPDFEPITGGVSQATTGHVLAMPTRLLHLAPNANTFTPIDIFPFGTALYAASADSNGHAWVAASNGLYEVNVVRNTVVNEAFHHNSLSVIPNPVHAGNNATVSCETCTSDEYVVYDILGNVVASASSPVLSTTGYAPGLYYLRNQDQAVRIVVQ